MITETYIKRDTEEIITIDIENKLLYIGNDAIYLLETEIKKINQLYEYNKEIFKEFIENIYIKYIFNIVSFFINNKITLEEIKQLNNIVLFYVNFDFDCNLILSDYEINIVDFFKYLYSQSYELISSDFVHKYFSYLKYNKVKLNKYNKFPHNPLLAYDILINNNIKRNKNKDIIKDIDGFHLEFYGSKCEYYITYKGKKYNLLNDEDKNIIILIAAVNLNFIYLSEYYKNDSLYNIILSFEDKEYYTKTIKEDIIYILKYNYKNINKKETKKIIKAILNSKKELYPIPKNLLTNNFKKNLYILDYLSLYTLYDNINKIYKDKFYQNKKVQKIINIFKDYTFSSYQQNNIIYKDDIEIKEIDFLEFINWIKKDEYLDTSMGHMINSYIYLCTDTKSENKLFVYKYTKESKEKNIVKFLNKEYNSNFLKRIENLEI